jgi:pantoate--beta-alanine ligase
VPLSLLDRPDALRKALKAERRAGRSIGLVPTMGYLHAGHISLMARAAAECDVAVATIFVNPLQFGPTEDLAGYPRDPDGDRAKAEAAGISYLFAPSQRDMFPDPPLTTVAVGAISERLEGVFRNSHFAGVATIVTKLLALAGPCRAYFGEKDYQQLVIIRRLVADLSLPVAVVGCPTVRQPDGLALSSRNAYLTPAERVIAPTLFRALVAGRAAVEDLRLTDAAGIRSAMDEVMACQPAFSVDYAAVAEPTDLSAVTTVTGEVRLLIAARLGRARLIDNLAARATPEAG